MNGKPLASDLLTRKLDLSNPQAVANALWAQTDRIRRKLPLGGYQFKVNWLDRAPGDSAPTNFGGVALNAKKMIGFLLNSATRVFVFDPLVDIKSLAASIQKLKDAEICKPVLTFGGCTSACWEAAKCVREAEHLYNIQCSEIFTLRIEKLHTEA